MILTNYPCRLWDCYSFIPEVRCLDVKTNRQAELRDCFKTTIPIPLSVQRCHIECHSPCQLTEWSAWPPCSGKCIRLRHRTRELIGNTWISCILESIHELYYNSVDRASIKINEKSSHLNNVDHVIYVL